MCRSRKTSTRKAHYGWILSYWKERVALAIAKELNVKIFVTLDKHEFLRLAQFDMSLFTMNPTETNLHFVSMVSCHQPFIFTTNHSSLPLIFRLYHQPFVFTFRLRLTFHLSKLYDLIVYLLSFFYSTEWRFSKVNGVYLESLQRQIYGNYRHSTDRVGLWEVDQFSRLPSKWSVRTVFYPLFRAQLSSWTETMYRRLKTRIHCSNCRLFYSTKSARKNFFFELKLLWIEIHDGSLGNLERPATQRFATNSVRMGEKQRSKRSKRNIVNSELLADTKAKQFQEAPKNCVSLFRKNW